MSKPQKTSKNTIKFHITSVNFQITKCAGKKFKKINHQIVATTL